MLPMAPFTSILDKGLPLAILGKTFSFGVNCVSSLFSYLLNYFGHAARLAGSS